MIEKKENSVPLPLAVGEQEREPEPGKTAAAPLTFRGRPIAWGVSQEMKTIVTPCAFGEDMEEQRPGRKKNYILYDGKQYTKEGFYRAMF